MFTVSKFKQTFGVHITTNHNDKMAGVSSVSTSPECNGLCKARTEVADMICAHCYSMVMQKRFRGLREALRKNSDILTTYLFEPDELPRLFSETGYFRFEAFGDLINEIQVANYFNMARYNPHMKCALWTKNPWIIRKAIERYGLEKPANLTIIGSSYYLNKPMKYEAFPFIDKVFTVYDREHAATVDINCGGRSCAECGRCYENKGGREVSELLK